MRHSFPSHPKSAYTYCLFFLLFVTPTIFAQCSLFLIFETGVFGKILDWSGWQEEEDKKKKNHSKNKQDKETKEYIKERIERTKNEMEAMVLSSKSVRSATQLYDDLFSNSKIESSSSDQIQKGKELAESMIHSMAANMNTTNARPAAYLLRKVWRSLYDSVNVDEVGIERVRSLLDGTASGQSNVRKKLKIKILVIVCTILDCNYRKNYSHQILLLLLSSL